MEEARAVAMSAFGVKRTWLKSPRMSASDAVDGSSTRHASAMDLGAARAPMILRSYPCIQLRQLV